MSDRKSPPPRYLELLLVRNVPSINTTGAGVKIVVCEWAFDFPFKAGMEIKGYHKGVDGKAFSVKLEKRGYFTAAGKVMTGKAEGFSLDDLAYLHPKWKEMIALMKHPPLPPAAPAPVRKPQDDVIEEVPF